MATLPAQHQLWPEGLRYLQNAVSEDVAGALVREIDAAVWQTDLKRRVQHYGYRYDYKARRARKEDYLGPLPPCFRRVAQGLVAQGYFTSLPDQVIVNEYQPGQGISPHIDCQPCFGDTIASLSLLSACVMQFAHPITSRRLDLTLAASSLLVLSAEARYGWTHAIAARKTDVISGQRVARSRRISLTFRTMAFAPPPEGPGRRDARA